MKLSYRKQSKMSGPRSSSRKTFRFSRLALLGRRKSRELRLREEALSSSDPFIYRGIVILPSDVALDKRAQRIRAAMAETGLDA